VTASRGRTDTLHYIPDTAFRGSCQWLGQVLYDLPVLRADSNGSALATITSINTQPLSSANNWYIAIDYNSTLNRNYFMPVSCGDAVVG
jgi:hypothetical protein